MAESWTPVVVSAQITPQPAVVGQSVLLSVAVTDVQSVERQEVYVAGEWTSGEV